MEVGANVEAEVGAFIAARLVQVPGREVEEHQEGVQAAEVDEETREGEAIRQQESRHVDLPRQSRHTTRIGDSHLDALLPCDVLHSTGGQPHSQGVARQHSHRECGGKGEPQQEVEVVSRPDALAYPRAVVVLARHAPVAEAAVRCPRGPPYATRLTPLLQQPILGVAERDGRGVQRREVVQAVPRLPPHHQHQQHRQVDARHNREEPTWHICAVHRGRRRHQGQDDQLRQDDWEDEE
mmetsp:Transcript_32520/g.94011  ORF Transcript_32520/g.94011 Transcript_32520/m.94011 type:complete len:238 (-) Transcript_32520:268-981(-)